MTFGRPPSTAPSASPTAGNVGDVIKDTTTAAFSKDVLESSKSALVLVDFRSPRSAASKQLTPILEKLVRGYAGKVRLVKMDTDAHPAIAGQLRVKTLPTVYAFRDGRPLDGFEGAQPETAVKEFIDRALGDDAADDLQAALDAGIQALEANDLQGAAEIFAALLQEDPQNPNALAGLAKCYLKSNDLERAEQTLALVAPDKRTTAAVSSVQAALDLAKQATNAVNWSHWRLRSLQTRKTIAHASISPWPWQRAVARRMRRLTCSMPSVSIANGKTRQRGSSWSNSSKPGGRKIRPRLMGDGGCPACCFPDHL